MRLLKSSKNRKELYAPLISLQTLITSYDRSLISSRDNTLEPILSEFFPYIENLAGQQLKEWCEESAFILNIILTCFKQANYLQLSKYVKQDELEIWLKLTGNIINNSIPDTETNLLTDWNEIYDRAENSIYWQAKVTSFEILYSLIRHCKPSRARITDQLSQFREYFNTNYSQGILDMAFNFIKNVNNFYIPPKLVAICLRTIRMGLKIESTNRNMSPMFHVILMEHVIPLLKFNQKDVEYWEES